MKINILKNNIKQDIEKITFSFEGTFEIKKLLTSLEKLSTILNSFLIFDEIEIANMCANANEIIRNIKKYIKGDKQKKGDTNI